MLGHADGSVSVVTVRWLRAVPVALALCAGTLGVRSAQAEDADGVRRAKALFADARLLVKSGYYVEACPKFEQSLALHAGLGTEFNLADCLDRTGHTERARTLFLDVANKAELAKQTEREQIARGRAAALAPTPPASESVQTSALVVVGEAPSADAQAEMARDCSEAPARVLSDESDALAEAALRAQALEHSAAQLIALAPQDPASLRVRRELAELETQLADAWRLAGQVATQLALRNQGASDSAASRASETPPPRPAAIDVANATADVKVRSAQ